jgi:hypothetical protein
LERDREKEEVPVKYWALEVIDKTPAGMGLIIIIVSPPPSSFDVSESDSLFQTDIDEIALVTHSISPQMRSAGNVLF